MSDIRENTNPFIFLILVLPYGISGGFVTVTLPFLLTQNGFPVAIAASVTAIGLSANIWRFIWAPMTDLSLSLNKWYVIGTIFGAFTLLLFYFIPLSIDYKATIMILVFISQVAATFIVAPVGGFMAKTVTKERKGMAGGCYQAGNLGGLGLGGGLGVWVSTHYSYHTALIVLASVMLCCSGAIYLMPYIRAVSNEKIADRIRLIGLDIKQLTHSPISLFTSFVVLTPIGVGAAAGLWSSVATEWKAGPDTVALATGMLSGIVTAFSCLLGGFISDKFGHWIAFFGSGALLALLTLSMGFICFIPATFTGGVLLYAFIYGINFASFSAVVLHAIGKGFASTKYALLSSLGNIPVTYMTALDGWMHDYFNIKFMLWGETLLGFVFILICLIIMQYYKLHKVSL